MSLTLYPSCPQLSTPHVPVPLTHIIPDTSLLHVPLKPQPFTPQAPIPIPRSHTPQVLIPLSLTPQDPIPLPLLPFTQAPHQLLPAPHTLLTAARTLHIRASNQRTALAWHNPGIIQPASPRQTHLHPCFSTPPVTSPQNRKIERLLL